MRTTDRIAPCRTGRRPLVLGIRASRVFGGLLAPSQISRTLYEIEISKISSTRAQSALAMVAEFEQLLGFDRNRCCSLREKNAVLRSGPEPAVAEARRPDAPPSGSRSWRRSVYLASPQNVLARSTARLPGPRLDPSGDDLPRWRQHLEPVGRQRSIPQPSIGPATLRLGQRRGTRQYLLIRPGFADRSRRNREP